MKIYKSPSPPRLAVWLVKHLERYQTNHAIVDDMQEVFTMICQERGFISACLWYWCQCLDAVIKNTLFNLKWRFVMFRNYFKVALRNILKHKGYSFINIFGLATGLTCSIFAMFYVYNEISYDRFHKKANQIYRVYVKDKIENRTIETLGTSAPLAKALKDEYPEILQTLRVSDSTSIPISMS